jgi:hypothetical protein
MLSGYFWMHRRSKKHNLFWYRVGYKSLGNAVMLKGVREVAKIFYEGIDV